MGEILHGRESARARSFSLKDLLACSDAARYVEEREAFVGRRLQQLINESKPVIIEAKKFGLHSGFIHPDSVVKVTQHEAIRGFKVDDPAIYSRLLNELRDRRSVPESVQVVIDAYFRISHLERDVERKDRRARVYAAEKPTSPLSSGEIADAHIAMCAEKSATAQNLIAFLGQQSWLIDSYAKIEWRDGTVEGGQHLYNIIDGEGDDMTLYDASHPFEVMYANGQVVTTKPAQFRITHEQFSALQRGEALHVQHKEERQEGRGTKVVLREYIYGGVGSVRK